MGARGRGGRNCAEGGVVDLRRPVSDHSLDALDVLRGIPVEHSVVVRPTIGAFRNPPKAVEIQLALLTDKGSAVRGLSDVPHRSL